MTPPKPSFVGTLLDRLTADELWEMRDRIDGFVKNATYPEVIVWAGESSVNRPRQHAPLDQRQFGLACPRCGHAGREDDDGELIASPIREVDSSDRWNEVGALIPADDGTLVVDIYGADSNFQTVGYVCAQCVLPCSLPSWIEEVWS